jgi:hypothetical protein
MVSPFAGARSLDIGGWLYGLASAGISSAGGALAAGFGPAAVDPKDFNFQHPALMLETAAIGAGIAGVISMGKFLSTQPLPSVKEVTATTQTITTAGASTPSKIIETVTEKHLEPIPPKPPDAQ